MSAKTINKKTDISIVYITLVAPFALRLTSDVLAIAFRRRDTSPCNGAGGRCYGADVAAHPHTGV